MSNLKLVSRSFALEICITTPQFLATFGYLNFFHSVAITLLTSYWKRNNYTHSLQKEHFHQYNLKQHGVYLIISAYFGSHINKFSISFDRFYFELLMHCDMITHRHIPIMNCENLYSSHVNWINRSNSDNYSPFNFWSLWFLIYHSFRATVFL